MPAAHHGLGSVAQPSRASPCDALQQSQGDAGTQAHHTVEAPAGDNGSRAACALRKLKLLSLGRCDSPRMPAGHGDPGIPYSWSRGHVLVADLKCLCFYISAGICNRLLSGCISR